MDSTEMKDYLLNSLCRICAEKSSKLIPIFEIKLLPLKICKCLPITVTASDGLPVNICDVCLVKIDESYHLYERCYYADQKLKKLWKTFVKTPEPELFVYDEVHCKDNLIGGNSYANISKEKKCSGVDDFVAETSKQAPVNVILISDGVPFEQQFENTEDQCGNKSSDILIPSDIIIKMGDDGEYTNLDDLDSANVLDVCKSDVQECDASKCDTVSQDVEIVEPDMIPSETVKPAETESNMIVYQCKFCPEQLTTLSSLTSHEASHSQDKPFLCDTCGKSFKNGNNLKSHVKIHSAQRKKYVCKVCNKAFFTNFFLQEHMNSHTGETPYKCGVCGKEFREKVHLRQHKWTHSSEKFLCPVCGNHFNRKGNLMEHIKKYHSSNEEEILKAKKSEAKKLGDAKFACPICSKSFASQVLLKNHHKRHLNKELHFCSLCGKQFRHSGSLTYHRRTAHTGEKPFKCSYCDEKFSLRSVQRIHERKKHTFEYPYKCPFCSRMFNNSSSLKNHSYVHNKEKMFECDICRKRFSRNSNLLVHKKIHTDDRQYVCEQCGKSYIQKHDMIKHKKIHDPKAKPFYCKYCANSFAHRKDFSRHAMCHFDYIRKSTSEIGEAEKILETVTGDLDKSSKTLLDAERLILETEAELEDVKLDKTDIT